MPPLMYLVYLFAVLYFFIGMKLMRTPFESPKLSLAVEIGITVVYLIAFLFIAFGVGYISSNQAREKKKIFYISSLKIDVEACIPFVTNAETKKQLEAFAEKIRFSDPMSHESLANCEKELAEAVASITTTLKADGTADVSTEIQHAIALLEYRNQRCLALK